MVQKGKRKTVVAFYGITRSLTYTVDSIERNILCPLRDQFECIVVGHLFDQKSISNPRSGEFGELQTDEYRLLPFQQLILEPPNRCLDATGFDNLCEFGDFWNDEFASLKNLVHQLYSLSKVTDLVLEHDPDICVFCRPDLRYHDSIDKYLDMVVRCKQPTVLLPRWQGHGGLNDRFAICSTREAIVTYGKRGRVTLSYCKRHGPLHGERLVDFVLGQESIRIKQIALRASRVRSSGKEIDEDFSHPIVLRWRKRALRAINRCGFSATRLAKAWRIRY